MLVFFVKSIRKNASNDNPSSFSISFCKELCLVLSNIFNIFNKVYVQIIIIVVKRMKLNILCDDICDVCNVCDNIYTFVLCLISEL